MSREMQSCSDCVFCILTEVSYQDYVYICNLGLDEIFHERNHDQYDTLGCESINDHPTTPCNARHDLDENLYSQGFNIGYKSALDRVCMMLIAYKTAECIEV